MKKIINIFYVILSLLILYSCFSYGRAVEERKQVKIQLRKISEAKNKTDAYYKEYFKKQMKAQKEMIEYENSIKEKSDCFSEKDILEYNVMVDNFNR